MALRTIGGELCRNVIGFDCVVIVVLVTTHACIRNIGVVPLVAPVALVGNIRMTTYKWKVRVVVIGGWNPGILIVAKFAVGWKLFRTVAWN